MILYGIFYLMKLILIYVDCFRFFCRLLASFIAFLLEIKEKDKVNNFKL